MNGVRIPEGLKQEIWTSTTLSAQSQTAGTINYIFSAEKGVSSATLLDTNITSKNRIPYAKAVVYGVNVYVGRDGNYGILSGLDVNAVLHNCSIKIMKNNVPKVDAMLWQIPAGCGVSGSQETGVTTTTVINVNNGEPLRKNYFPLKNMETFTQSDYISGEIKIESAWTVATALRITVYLLAYVQRDLN